MSERAEERTTAERITLVVSLTIVVAIIAIAAWSSARTGNDPASIRVESHIERVRESEGRYYVPVTITNTGGRTAQDVTITGELDTGGPQPETAQVIITFLAGDETEHAELIFTTDPTQGDFTVGATSFLEP